MLLFNILSWNISNIWKSWKTSCFAFWECSWRIGCSFSRGKSFYVSVSVFAQEAILTPRATDSSLSKDCARLWGFLIVFLVIGVWSSDALTGAVMCINKWIRKNRTGAMAWVGQNGFRFVLKAFITKVTKRERRFQTFCHSCMTFIILALSAYHLYFHIFSRVSYFFFLCLSQFILRVI